MKEKIIKNNLFNRLFRSSTISSNYKKFEEILAKVALYPSLSKELSKCTTLRDLLDFHKHLWAVGYKNTNLGPDIYGMFRSDDISTMSPNQVFLGNVDGIWTNTIPEFEELRLANKQSLKYDQNFDDYFRVFLQYYQILHSNFEQLYEEYKLERQNFISKNYK